MTTKEMNILQEEELEKAAGGVITTEGDPQGSGDTPSGNPDDPDCRPEFCPYYSVDKNEVIRCLAPITKRTRTACPFCTAQGIFTLK